MRYFNPYMFVLFACFSFTQLKAQTPLQCDGKFFVSHSKGSGATDSTYVDRITFNGGTTAVTPFGNTGTYGVNALGFNPADGYIYALQYHQYTPFPTRLIRIDATGTFYDLGSITGDFPLPSPTGSNAFAGCFDKNGTYYVSEDPADGLSGNIYTIDVTTNVSTLVGSTNIVPTDGTDIFLADLAINPVTGKLYGVTNFCCGESSINTSAVFEINKTTGAATWIRQLAPLDSYFGMVFNDDGELFAYKSNGSLYKLNLTSGDITQVAVGQSFTFADAANCSFRVSNYLSANASCAGSSADVAFTARINNYSVAAQTGVGYELILPADFYFTQTPAVIEAALAPLYGGGVTATISSVSGGTNNKINIANMSVAVNDFITPSTSFTLHASIDNPTVDYAVAAQVTGLSTTLGVTDESDDPTTGIEEDSTQLLVSSICTVLPVKLISFEAIGHKTYSALSWVVPAETNSAYFIVERSVNGQNWNAIGKVTATNNNHELKYNFTDATPYKGINYYRLKQVNADQHFDYSTIRSVQLDTDKKLVTVFPNPSHVTFQLQSSVNKTSLYQITDVSGRIVKKGQFNSNLNVNRLTPGVYVAKVKTENITETIKIVVQ